MRPSNKQRSRNKPGSNGNHNNPRRGNLGNIINRVFESAGPDGKVRGTPQQIIDKYQALARDAQVSGDRVAAESYLQHSEHYSRLLGEAQRQQMENRINPEREDGPREEGFDHQRRPQPNVLSMASGLTTIDPDDPFEMVGPIETPEGRRQPTSAPEPFVVAEAAPNGGGQPAPQPEPEPQAQPDPPTQGGEPEQAAAPAKRPRRRPRAEAPAPAARAE